MEQLRAAEFRARQQAHAMAVSQQGQSGAVAPPPPPPSNFGWQQNPQQSSHSVPLQAPTSSAIPGPPMPGAASIPAPIMSTGQATIPNHPMSTGPMPSGHTTMPPGPAVGVAAGPSTE